MALTRRDAMKAGAAVTAAATAPAAAAKSAQAPATTRKTAGAIEATVRDRLLLDFGWRFHLGHACDPEKDFGFGVNQRTYAKAGEGVALAAAADFDDSGWRPLDLPHDWAVDLPFTPSANPPAGDDPRAAHGFKPLGREYPETSIGWYRRSFELPASDLGRRLFLEFDGVFQRCMVMFNGYIVGTNGSGYTPFRVDVSDFANYGGKNVLVVRVDATLGEGWFYEGAGIYRHVWLVKQDPLHIPQWGVWVKSALHDTSAALTIATELSNDGAPRTAHVVSRVYDPEGRQVVTLRTPQLHLGASERRTATQYASIPSAKLWSPDNPALYRVLTHVVVNGKVVDDCVTTFGIRTIHFDAEKGFFLNGKPFKLNGSCNHQDHAGVGVAVPDELQAWRVARLKDFGCNAYRMSHNPPAPELLDACDRLGMLVIDETRRMSADKESLSDLATMIRRDRNHPSIILWSIGNEEPQQGTERGARVGLTMKQVCNALDPTRPITAAIDNPAAWATGFSPLLDVVGGNYRTNKMPAFHEQHPKVCLVGTETGSTVATRGIYVRDAASGYCVAYDTEHPWWAATAEEWMTVAMPASYIAGGFVWTGFDYRGEPTPFNKWPNVSSQFGILDTCGFAKDNFYYYKAWWGSEPVLHLFPHWNWTAGQKVNVWCHSNLDTVELFLNGQSLGTRKVELLKHVEWDVTFAPGTLEARGYRNGKVMLTAKRETTGGPAQILLKTDRTALNGDGEDVAVVSVEVVDREGRLVPTAGNLVSFRVSGPAKLIGVGNGDPRSHEPDQADQRSVFNGLCSAILQSAKTAGDIRLEASSPGLRSAVLVLAAKPAKPRPSL